MDRFGEEHNIKWPDNSKYSGEVFITYSVSKGGRNENEVRSWSRVFEELDKYPHMIRFYKGKKPSDLFSELVWKHPSHVMSEDEKEEVGKKREELKISKKENLYNLNQFMVLPIEFSSKEYRNKLSEYNDIIAKVKDLKEKINIEERRILEGTRKGMSVSVNSKKKSSFEEQLSFLETQHSNLLNDKNISYVKSKLEKGYEYSIITDKRLFLEACELASSENALCGNHEINIQNGSYSTICMYYGLEEENSIFKNISGTINTLVGNEIVKKDNKLSIVDYSNLSNKIAKLCKALSLKAISSI